MGLRDRLKNRVRTLVRGDDTPKAPTRRRAAVQGTGEPFPASHSVDGLDAVAWDKELGFETPVYRTHPDGTPLVLMQLREAVVAYEWDRSTQGALRYDDGHLVGPDATYNAFTGLSVSGAPPLSPRACRSRHRVVWVGGAPGGEEVFAHITVDPATHALSKAPGGSPPVDTLWVDLTSGEGPPCAEGDAVMVHYVGLAWSTGEVFHDTWERRSAYPAKLVEGALIEGFFRGLIGMRQGGTRLLVMPPWHGFGEDGSEDVVLPGETLVFYVERGATV